MIFYDIYENFDFYQEKVMILYKKTVFLCILKKKRNEIKAKMIECQFCNNIFGDTKMLRQHQKRLSIELHITILQLSVK